MHSLVSARAWFKADERIRHLDDRGHADHRFSLLREPRRIHYFLRRSLARNALRHGQQQLRSSPGLRDDEPLQLSQQLPELLLHETQFQRGLPCGPPPATEPALESPAAISRFADYEGVRLPRRLSSGVETAAIYLTERSKRFQL